jgi:hypothetical protein
MLTTVVVGADEFDPFVTFRFVTVPPPLFGAVDAGCDPGDVLVGVICE